jgi:hypothetical protein
MTGWCPIAKVYNSGCNNCNLYSSYNHDCKFIVAFKEALAKGQINFVKE